MHLIAFDRSQKTRVAHLLTASTVALAIWLALILRANTPTVSAHAGFAESDPAPNTVVGEAPEVVTIRFTEPLEWSFSTADLYDQSGEVVSGTSVQKGADEFELALKLPSGLPNGTYSVLWRTLSTADGHTAQNYFAFTVGSEDDIATTEGPSHESDVSTPPLWLQTVSRWVAYLGLAAAVAAWPVWLLVIRPSIGVARAGARPLVRRMQTFTYAALLLALTGNTVAIAVQALSLADGSLLERIRSTLGNTRYGELWYMRVALLLIYAITLQWVAWWWPRRRLELSIGAFGLAISLVLPFSYISHASAQTTGRTAAILNDVLHLLAASLWAGGLMAIATVLLPEIQSLHGDYRRSVLSSALARFSTLALTAWTTMALTGIYSAWLQVGGVDALLETDYGNALLIKLVLLVPILALAAFNLFVFTSRLKHLGVGAGHAAAWNKRFAVAVGAEVLLAIGVLAVVGALTAQAPARESLATAPEPVEVALTGGELDTTLTIAPGTPGPNRFVVEVGDAPMPHDAEVLLRVSSSDQDTGEKELPFTHSDTNRYGYDGSELSLAGEWEFELVVRPPDAFEWRAYGTATIEPLAPSAGASRPSWVLSSLGGTSGILFVLLGMATLIVGWRSPWSRYRTRLLATGAGALALGAIVTVSSRTDLSTIAAGTIALFV